MAPSCSCGDGSRDDTAPMILCDNCAVWYHFDCIRLSESDADDIASYVCPDCQLSTGLKTVHTWEGQDALEEVPPPASPTVPREPKEDATTDDDNEKVEDDDEYTDDRVAKRRRLNPRQNGRHSQVVVDSDATSDEDKPRRPPKRKASSAAKPAPAKRARSQSTRDAGDDPTRKYCTGKLLEVLEPVFNDYHNWPDAQSTPPKNRELAPEDKEAARQAAADFVRELEQALFDHYAEPDKLGQPAASGKYKERFRMLTFNLAKEDRVVLRRRIVTSDLPALELAQMSSTDLANEQTKQAIEHAMKESLEHSILEARITAPRAKMTHKGMEMVEDLTFTPAELPPERPRVLTALKRESTLLDGTPTSAGGSTPQTPALPTPHIGGGKVKPAGFVTSPTQRAPSSTSYFVPSVPEATEDTKTEDDAMQVSTAGYEDGMTKGDASTTLASLATPTPSTSMTDAFQMHHASSSPTRRASFNLGTLWSDAGDPTQSPTQHFAPVSMDPNLASFNMDMDDPFGEAGLPGVEAVDLGGANDDKDFDMFLADEDPVKSAPDPLAGLTPEQIAQASYEALPVVFSGEFAMPDMSSCAVRCRQVGGRELSPGGAAWPQLFTAQKMRIDGRVPVHIGAKYLVDSRLNPGRELIAVALTPASPQDDVAFDALVDVLSKKERYGVSFPWGNPQGPQAPGKELYILPLLPHASLPESIELLDNVRVPQPRSRSTLLGIFVLHKGKVIDTPVPTPAPTPAAPLALPASVLAQLPSLVQTVYTPPPPIPMYPGAAVPAAVPGYAPPQPAVPAGGVTNLTPEQISLMLRSLSHLTQAGAQPPAVPTPPPPPMQMPGYPTHPAPPPYGAYPPVPPPQHQLPQQHMPPPPPPAPVFHAADARLPPGGLPPPLGFPVAPPHPPPRRGHSHRGARGGGRGGGPPGPDERQNSADRQRDAGWRGRGRGRPAAQPSH